MTLGFALQTLSEGECRHRDGCVRAAGQKEPGTTRDAFDVRAQRGYGRAMDALTEQEVARIRDLFPALESYTYFTTNGLGVVSRRVADVLREHVEDLSRNAIVSALFRNAPLLSETRGRVASLLGCEAREVAFCRNTSEGVLWAASGLRWQPGDEVLVAQGEYPANVLPWMAQESRGVVTRLLRQPDRRITAERVAEAWSPRTRRRGASATRCGRRS